MKNQVQLITYVDRFGGGGLADLQTLLTGPLHGVFGGVHLLPFFHTIDGADAGRFLTTVRKRLEEGAFEADLGL